MNRYSQDRITRLVRDGHITLLAEWVNWDGRMVGHRLKHNFEEDREGNWWAHRTAEAPHHSRFALGKHDRIVAAVEPWEGRRGSVVAFRINDPESWAQVIRRDARIERDLGWRD